MHLFFGFFLLGWAIFSLILHSFYVFSKIGVKDIPNQRSLHTETTKKSGGMVFVPLFLILVFYVSFFENTTFFGTLKLPETTLPLFICASGFCILGFLDDLFQLSPILRLFIEISLVFSFLYFVSPKITFLGHSFLSPFVVYTFLTIFIVFAVNLVNFMDGMDWYLVSTLGLSSISWGILHPNLFGTNQIGFVLLGFLFVSSFGFFFYNFPKAKLFMGDSGSLTLGFLFMGLPLCLQVDISTKWELFDYFFIFPYFWMDGVFTLCKRAYEKKHVLNAHREHLYQKITETKLGKVGSLAIFTALNLIVIMMLFVMKLYRTDMTVIYIILTVFIFLTYFTLWVLVARKNLA
ncbi:sugar phosphotransferase [Leptospira sp. 96542]|nr:sugar phosphotransferase [Leptospira sp. 96542]